MASTSLKDHYQVRKDHNVHDGKGSTASTPKHETDDEENLTALEKNMAILKQFDLTWQYGPSIGMTRLERWERAEKYGLSPPHNVKDLLLEHADNEKYTHCLWNEYSTLM